MELQIMALPAAYLWGRSALLTIAITVATRFQQVPIFDKKKGKKRKKLKGSLNLHWLSFLADHLVCPQQVTGPSNCLPYVYYPSAMYLRSISYDLLSWIIISFLICFKSVIPYHIDVILSQCIL